jgi:alkylhydroperoxidase/carboxymuconolactone decarboxylase family protein YurZ
MMSIDEQMADALKEVPADAPVLETLLRMQLDIQARSGLDNRTYLLVRLAALIALDAPADAFYLVLSLADEAGLTPADVQGALVAVAPAVGAARTMSAAAKIRTIMEGR